MFDGDTDLTIDFMVVSKYCHKCTNREARLKKALISPEDAEEEKQSHQCFSSFSGPSSEMERFAMKELFQRSKEYNLVYKNLITDGDTKSFTDV